MDNLIPINGYVLVELAEQYEYAATPEQQYSTKTSGIVRKVESKATYRGEPIPHQLEGKKIWFKSFEDDVKLGEDNRYTFIKFEDIKGFLDE